MSGHLPVAGAADLGLRISGDAGVLARIVPGVVAAS
jgi:hypothetical protein